MEQHMVAEIVSLCRGVKTGNGVILRFGVILAIWCLAIWCYPEILRHAVTCQYTVSQFDSS